MDFILNLDPKLQAVIISVIAAIISSLITIYYRQKHERANYKYKVELDYELEQRKKIKEVLSKHIIKLVEAVDLMRGRFNNISKLDNHKGLNKQGVYGNFDHHYFHSTVYRFISLFGEVRLMKKDLTILDTTIASEKDINLLKYIEVIKRILQKGDFLSKITGENKKERKKDIIYKDAFKDISSWIINPENKILSYRQYVDEAKKETKSIDIIYHFFDGLSKDGPGARRWERTSAVHLILICFLNSYGYDYHYRGEKAIKKTIKTQGEMSSLDSLIKLLKAYKLDKESSTSQLIKIINTRQEWWSEVEVESDHKDAIKKA